MIWTDDYLIFSRVENDTLIDSIPLAEVKSIDQFDETSSNANHQADEEDSSMNQFQSLMTKKKSMLATVAAAANTGPEPSKQDSPSKLTIELEPQASLVGGNSAVFTRMMHSKVMQIKTDRDGHNSGRTYYLKTSEPGDFGQVIAKLSSLSKTARKRAENKTRFERQQQTVRRFYNSNPFQYMMAALIFGVMMRSMISIF